MIYHDGFDLPMFAAFVLLESDRGRAALQVYFDRYAAMAVKHGTGFILESPTWRANPDWGEARLHRAGLPRQPRRDRHDARGSGSSQTRDALRHQRGLGPRADGYHPARR